MSGSIQKQVILVNVQAVVLLIALLSGLALLLGFELSQRLQGFREVQKLMFLLQDYQRSHGSLLMKLGGFKNSSSSPEFWDEFEKGWQEIDSTWKNFVAHWESMKPEMRPAWSLVEPLEKVHWEFKQIVQEKEKLSRDNLVSQWLDLQDRNYQAVQPLRSFFRSQDEGFWVNWVKKAVVFFISGLWGVVLIVGFLKVRVLGSFFRWLVKQVGALWNIGAQSQEGFDEVSKTAQSILNQIEVINQTTQQLAQAVDEITAMATRTSQKAQNIQNLNQGVLNHISTSEENLGRVLNSIQELHHVNQEVDQIVEQFNQAFHQVVQIMEEIEKQTGAIHDIVFQSKILSFNAQVEAARAGEHGRGFAVVAEEIGNLAQMSGQSANQIRQLIQESQKQIHEIINQLQANLQSLSIRSHETSSQIMQNIQEMDQSLKQVVESSQELNGANQEIQLAVQEQESGLKQSQKALADLRLQVQEVHSRSERIQRLTHDHGGWVNQIFEIATGLAQKLGLRQLGFQGGAQTHEVDSLSSKTLKDQAA